MTVGSITKPAIFLGKLGSLDNQKIEKLGIPCTGSSVELVEVCFNFLPSSKNGHLQLQKLDLWPKKPTWNLWKHLPGIIRHVTLPMMMAECNVYINLWMQTEFLSNFYIFGIFSGTLGLILFCFLEARKTLQSSKGEPPFESSWKTGPRRSLQKPYNSQIKELHSNHLWCFKMWDWNLPQNRVVGKSIGTVLLRYKYL